VALRGGLPWPPCFFSALLPTEVDGVLVAEGRGPGAFLYRFFSGVVSFLLFLVRVADGTPWWGEGDGEIRPRSDSVGSLSFFPLVACCPNPICEWCVVWICPFVLSCPSPFCARQFPFFCRVDTGLVRKVLMACKSRALSFWSFPLSFGCFTALAVRAESPGPCWLFCVFFASAVAPPP